MDWFLLALKKYADFTGRSRRKEYWMFLLFNVLIAVGLGIVDGILGTVFIGGLFALATLIPGISCAARRLHDTGRSGWWLLISFVPLVGVLVVIYFLVLDSDAGDNAYGPNPKAAM